jgi:hypothetical protein
MADSKISALPASTTPLAGTEVLPIVQSSTTKQVSVANLTAGRAISATQLTLTTGNLIVASGQGIDFSATSGSGTSELFNDYEEGVWTPVIAAYTGSITSYTSAGTYTKIGQQVTVSFIFTITNNGTGATLLQVSGLPFTPNESTTLYACSANNRSTANTLYAEVANIKINIYSAVGLYPGVTGNNYCVTSTYFV